MKTYFIISFCVAIAGVIGAIINMAFISKWRAIENPVILHLIFVGMWIVGILCSILFGVLWAVEVFKP
jgi:hypothetical protein